MLAAAAALLLTVVQSPAAAPASPATLTPDQQAGGLAASAFAFACISRLGAATSVGDYAAGAETLGVSLAHDHPEAPGFRLDGAGGRGCRIRYAGPQSERLWSAFTRAVELMAPTPDGGGCKIAERSDMRLRASCVDTTKGPRRATLTLERSAASPAATITASLLPDAF